jgi:hypothetical protein
VISFHQVFPAKPAAGVPAYTNAVSYHPVAVGARIYFRLLSFTMQQYRGLKLNIFKFVTALHFLAYLAIIRCIEIVGNCCAFRAAEIIVFIFILFLNKVNLVPPPVPHVLPSWLPVAYQVCSVDFVCDIVVDGKEVNINYTNASHIYHRTGKFGRS